MKYVLLKGQLKLFINQVLEIQDFYSLDILELHVLITPEHL